MHFETVIGLEVHVELKTDSKMFSPSPAHFGAEPNSNTNVIDLAYPGVLPVVNRRAVDWAMRASMALNMDIATNSKFDRKNYFYPDNPKAYQISQFDQPIGENGYIDIEVDGETKRIGITRLHMEEDAGKSTHKDGYSLVDLNRQGTPLIEIVSEPDIRSPKEAYAYLEKLRSIIQYTGVSDCKMEEGSLRCDANISLRPYGQKEFGTKTELKNLNSFNYVKKGLEYEEKRQEEELLNGGDAKQIMEDKGLVQISDEATLLKFVTDALDNNPQSIEDYKNGKGKAMGFLVGQIMKASKGQANPQKVNSLLKQELDNR